MKLGETTDPIYALSFPVQDGYSTPAYPYDEAVKILEAMDGTVEVINFGAREHRTAEFVLNYIPRSAFYELTQYLESNAGKKIRLEKENAGEHVFGEQYPGPVWYAYLVAAEPLGETGFSDGHQLYGVSLQLDYAGATAAAVPNAADTSNYDFLFKMDCVQATHQATNKAALDALPNVPGGSIGLTTSDLKVYIFNANPARKVGGVVVGAGWDYLYPLPPNDPSRGLRNGVFRLSAFADIGGASLGLDGEDWKSGWIAHRGIKFPRYFVDARKGPAVEHPEGFTVELDNSNELWKFPVEQNLPFYGARCELSIYDRLAGRLILFRSGFNNQNVNDTRVLTFQVEPGILFQNKSFPSATIGADNFPSAAEKVRGKSVLATYGRWDKGELQSVAFQLDAIRFPNGRSIVEFIGWDSLNLHLTLDIPPAQVQTVLGYTLAEYPKGAGRYLYVQIFAQANQEDLSKFRKVTAVTASGGATRFTLEAAYSDLLDQTALFKVFLSNVQIIVDEQKVVGMRSSGYLRKATADGKAPMEFFGEVDGRIHKIPSSVFKVVENGKENMVTLDSKYMGLDAEGKIILSESVILNQVDPQFIHSIVDRTHVNGYGYFNFGFSPDGIETAAFKVLVSSVAPSWSVNQPVITGQRALLYAAFSADRATLIWPPFTGATGYRITRHKYYKNDRSDIEIDLTFGGGLGVELEDGSTAAASGGVVTIPGGAAFVAVDKSVDPAEKKIYVYRIEPIAGGTTQPALESNSGRAQTTSGRTTYPVAVGLSGAAVLAWPIPLGQQAVTIFQDGAEISSMPLISTTRSWYRVNGLTNNQYYKFHLGVNYLAIGTGGDTWFQPAGLPLPVHGTHQLLHASDPYTGFLFGEKPATSLDDPTVRGYETNRGVKINLLTTSGLDLPPAAVVFSWLYKVDKEALGDLSGAKDVRLLADFVVRSYYGNNSQVPIFIQLRGISADRRSIFVLKHPDTDAGAGLACKAPTEGSSFGAYAQFLNLKGSQNGTGSDANYDTDASSSNANGLYTGKDLWKLPDWLFDNGGELWSEVEYLMFSVTNAVPVPYAHVRPAAPFAGGLGLGNYLSGYHLGIGGPWGKDWAQVKNHKSAVYIEYTREIDGGLQQPLIGRIDGGRVDDAAGSITGTPNRIIEKARHVVDHVVKSSLGYKPKYVGNEMKSRDGWIWRWQAKESKPLKETLELLAKNIHGLFVLSPDDKLYLRSLSIDEPGVKPVFSFTESNILTIGGQESLGNPEYRPRNEIYQKFRFLYNMEPSHGGDPTEEIILGWDMQTSKPIFGGYPRVSENADGVLVNLEGLDGLDKLCRLSSFLYASGGKINEYGFGAGNEKVFEMFYRPTEAGAATGLPVERELPNLSTLWGPGVMAPKRAMQALVQMVVKSLCFDTWYFPLACSMRNIIYNPAVLGFADEAGTSDNKLKLGDLVQVTAKKTGGQALLGKVLGIDPSPIYDGYVVLNVFCPRPPGVNGPFVDRIWNAGAPGPRVNADKVFKGNLYGLLSENGTFADAKGPGSRDTNLMTFPDGSYADAQGSGSGKA